MDNPKRWWAPVWTGLVMDRDGKHYRCMKSALWLFLYLLLGADRRTGQLKRKVLTISTDMGMSRDTVLRWISTLRRGGYIETRNTGRCLHIQITHWKPLASKRISPPQERQQSATSSGNYATAPHPQNPPIPASARHESTSQPNPNDRSIKKQFLKIDIEAKYSQLRDRTANPRMPKAREQLLAQDLAQGLGDLHGFPLYLSYAKRYPESGLRAIMAAVREIPPERIKKSRGALFNYLVQQTYEKQSQDHCGS